MADTKPISPSKSPSLLLLLAVFAVPIGVAMLLYGIDEFNAAPLPEEGLSPTIMAVPKHYNRVLSVMEKVGDGLLPGPEDLVYDAEAGVIYASCNDGWIYKVRVASSAAEATVEKWVHVGGRPLGLAFGSDNELIVAESDKGLMKVTKDGVVQLLTDEADGVKFGLINGVDVAENGVIYFTDASYKYNFDSHMLDILEGRPYGRVLSYDLSTNQTKVLVKDLYFANGIALSPQQDFVVFCESVTRRCRKYYIQGEKKGLIDNFVESLPGFPDNLHCDGEGHFWLALAIGLTPSWDAMMRYPWIRKTIVILSRYVNILPMQQDAGVIVIDLNGDVIVRYSDPGSAFVTAGIKIDNYIYYGALFQNYIARFSLSQIASFTVV